MGLKKHDIDDIFKQELKTLAMNYSYSTDINCSIFDKNGERLISSNYPIPVVSFCNLVQSINPEICTKCYVLGGVHSEKIGEAYMFFCPYGLVNWMMPIINLKQETLYVTGGPILIHEIDDFLLKTIYEAQPLLVEKITRFELENMLKEIKIIKARKARYLVDLLFRASKSIANTDILKLNHNRQYNLFKSELVDNISDFKKTSKDFIENSKSYLYKKEEILISQIKLGYIDVAREILNEIIAFMFYENADNMDYLKWRTSKLIIILAQVFCDIGADANKIKKTKFEYLELIYKANNINDLSMHLHKVFNYFSNLILPIVNVKNRDLVLQAINYIRENIYKNISLKEVASQVNIHPVNFSKIFKKETGELFTDYVNRLKTELSKELLNEKVPLADVAVILGYNDQSYFTKMFKKYQGATPKDWLKHKAHLGF